MTQGSQTGSTLTDRAIVRLSGENVRGFVQGLATSDVAGDLPVWAGLLTAQGKCLFDFMIDSAAVKMLMLKPIMNQATQTTIKAICA